MLICLETMSVIEKYAKNGSKHENEPNWAGSRVQAKLHSRFGELEEKLGNTNHLHTHLVAAVISTPAPSRTAPDLLKLYSTDSKAFEVVLAPNMH
ncbi:hypothetical protein E3N88_21109 [Mikania micrantha]|uniref:Uncharacterized protein n=1 Tax=Mikania micrantha TaxID=192012 RepID=A0A5N6NIW2_9ASTR|nr:hypothetical protein E3N88_21109 [Mikania micrantha]